ncbi:MAG: hypothetical protein HZC28_04040 [Spirochaetes bacterium]|nr:hypothetical protein [Spirochaetota bacterium]
MRQCLVILLLAATASASIAATRIAVLNDNISAIDPAVITALSARCSNAGFPVTQVRCGDLSNQALFSRERFDCLLLTASPYFPGAAKENLLAFVKAGGNLVLLGGHAFSRPVAELGGEWLPRDEYVLKLYDNGTFRELIAVSSNDIQKWKRSTNKPEHPSAVSFEPGRTGTTLCLDICDIGEWQWDTFAMEIPGFAEGENAIGFHVRTTEETPNIAVELDEKDGTRWIAVVDTADEWRTCVLTAADFKFRGGGKRTDAAKTGIAWNTVGRISFGLAAGLTTHPNGDHRISIERPGALRVTSSVVRDLTKRVELPLFENDVPYHITDGVSIVPLAAAPVQFPAVSGSFRGLSAVAPSLLAKSEFTPLARTLDEFGRTVGWAAGLVVNYGGAYKGSQWFIAGITNQSLYTAKAFLDLFAASITAMGKEPATPAPERMRDAAALSSIALRGPALITGDRFTEKGKPLFLIGVNYLGPWNRFCRPLGATCSPRLIEEDFRKAAAAGINAMRIWSITGATAEEREHIRYCARNYGIYLLIVTDKRERDGDASMQFIGTVAAAWKDEPMVLGYDLANEPSIEQIAGMKIGGEESPWIALAPSEKYASALDTVKLEDSVKKRPTWYGMPNWIKNTDEHVAREIYTATQLYKKYFDRYIGGGADYSTFTGVSAPLVFEGAFADAARAMDATLGRWIERASAAIRAEDRTHYITVGYNTVLDCLPANERLDFINHHVYQKPTSFTNVVKNITTMDRLKKVFPKKPVTLGEFGYSNGLMLKRGRLDRYTSAVGECLHYLYAYTKGYSGAFKWMLNDLTPALVRDNVPWISPDLVYEHRFGMFLYDGTDTGRPKPIVYTLSFLNGYTASGGDTGTLEMTAADNAIGTAYVFTAPKALFIGNTSYSAERLSFTSEKPANMMLTWDENGIRLCSSADARVVIAPSKFGGYGMNARGKHGGLQRSTGQLTIFLLEGETVTIH